MDNKSKNNPSTEGKAPDTAATTSTAATDTAASTTATSTATADTSATKATAMEQNAKGTTPATDATATTPADAEPAAPEQNSAADTLPNDYLKGGYFRGEGKYRYTDPALIDHAKVFGKALADSGTPASAMNRLVRTLKTASHLPYPAMVGALKKVQAQAIDIEHRKKTGPLLREIVNRNMAAIGNEADYREFLEHVRDIAVFLKDNV